MLGAVGDRLRAATGGIAGNARAIFDDTFHAQFFIQFSRFASCCPMKIIKFLFVIGHCFLNSLAILRHDAGLGSGIKSNTLNTVLELALSNSQRQRITESAQRKSNRCLLTFSISPNLQPSETNPEAKHNPIG